MSFLSRFDAVLFDLNGTLAMGYDRFDADQDYYATYARLGGSELSPSKVAAAVEESIRKCLQRYEHGPWDPFPEYGEFLQISDAGERRLLEDTVAEHELGRLPAERLAWLEALSGTHGLGLVSDVWAPSRRLRRYLAESGLAGLLDAIVLSSELGAVKPSARVFAAALTQLSRDPGTVVFVGDNYRRDVMGAASLGMATVWIGDGQPAPGPVTPDRIVTRVEDLD